MLFARFSLSDSRCMSEWRDNQYNTEADRGNILGQPMLFVCMGICVLSPAHESEMGGLPCFCADCKILIPPILLKFSHSVLDCTALSWNFLGIFKNILEGSVDHVIYRDYTVNRRFLFTVVAGGGSWLELRALSFPYPFSPVRHCLPVGGQCIASIPESLEVCKMACPISFSDSVLKSADPR